MKRFSSEQRICVIAVVAACKRSSTSTQIGMKEKCRDGCRTSLLIAAVVLVPAIFHTSLSPCHPYITIHFMEMIFLKEKCRDGCRTSLLIAAVVLVPAIFHTSLSPCHPYITIHFMEMIFSTLIIASFLPSKTVAV